MVLSPWVHKTCEEGMEEIGVLDFSTKLKQLKGSIKEWNTYTFGHIDRNIKKLEQEKLDVDKLIEEGVVDEEIFARQRALKVRLEKWHEQRTSHWSKLSREKFMKGMDKNSKYFHTIL